MYSALALVGLIIFLSCTGIATQQNSLVESGWKTYTNNQLGFTFQYPDSWIKEVKDAEVTSLKGMVTEIDLNFTDTLSHTTLFIAYHLAPNGAELYKYAVSQFESSQGWYAKGGKQIIVAGNKAIQADMTSTFDGRGNKLNPPLRSIIVDFPDMKQTGEIELQFKTPLSNEDNQVAMFNKLLSGFKFTEQGN